jgi:hypothetical protein
MHFVPALLWLATALTTPRLPAPVVTGAACGDARLFVRRDGTTDVALALVSGEAHRKSCRLRFTVDVPAGYALVRPAVSLEGATRIGAAGTARVVVRAKLDGAADRGALRTQSRSGPVRLGSTPGGARGACGGRSLLDVDVHLEREGDARVELARAVIAPLELVRCR